MDIKNLVAILKGIIKFITTGLDKEKNYVIFPNGLKVCWGQKQNLSSRSNVTLPITFESGVVLPLPWYNTLYSWRCTFSTGVVSGNSFEVWAYDTSTKVESTHTNIAVCYIVVGY